MLLAAGRARRMGYNKLLAEHRGEALVVTAVRALAGSALTRIVVVTGHEGARVRAAIEACDGAGKRVTFAHNPQYPDGLSASLRVGLEALPDTVAVAVVMLADMPFVTTATVDALLAASGGSRICVPTVAGRRGNPVLWPRRLFPEMRAVSGDQGAKGLLAKHAEDVFEVAFEHAGPLVDVDTPEDFARLALA